MRYSYDYYFAHPTLSVDPIFSHVMSKKENCLRMLQICVAELDVADVLEISPQKSASVKLLEKGVRYDVWVVDRQGKKFDIECQTTSDPNILDRAYEYQLKLMTTVNQTRPGQKRKRLKPSYVLFFCTFQPPKEQTEAKISYSMYNDRHKEKAIERFGHLYFFNTKAPDRSMLAPEAGEFLDALDGRIKEHASKFIIKLQDDMNNYINTEEWSDFMNDFQLYREDLIKEGKQQGLAEGEEHGEINGAQKLIARLRNFHISDSQIMQSLKEDYGSILSNEQLEQMLKASK